MKLELTFGSRTPCFLPIIRFLNNLCYWSVPPLGTIKLLLTLSRWVFIYWLKKSVWVTHISTSISQLYDGTNLDYLQLVDSLPPPRFLPSNLHLLIMEDTGRGKVCLNHTYFYITLIPMSQLQMEPTFTIIIFTRISSSIATLCC